MPNCKCRWGRQLDADVTTAIMPVRDTGLSRRPDGSVLPAGVSVQLDREKASAGSLLAEHVIGIEQHTAIERETTAADAPG